MNQGGITEESILAQINDQLIGQGIPMLHDPVGPPPKLVQLRISICVNCWDGNIRFPLITTRGWVDQGIDLFPDQQFVQERHLCQLTALRDAVRAGSEDAVRRWAFDTNRVSGKPRGRWVERALNITPEMRDGLIQYLESILKAQS